MDALTKGSWIINTVKHTSEVRTNTIELVDLEATERAGKCGLLLSKLMADSQEIIDDKKLIVFARQSYISPEGINTCIDILKQQGQVDYKKDHLDRISEVEIYCFSKDSAIETTANIFDNYEPGSLEIANLLSNNPTVIKSRYCKPLAISTTLPGIDLPKLAINSLTGIVEKK